VLRTKAVIFSGHELHTAIVPAEGNRIRHGDDEVTVLPLSHLPVRNEQLECMHLHHILVIPIVPVQDVECRADWFASSLGNRGARIRCLLSRFWEFLCIQSRFLFNFIAILYTEDALTTRPESELSHEFALFGLLVAQDAHPPWTHQGTMDPLVPAS